MIRGSCLCGGVRYEVHGPVSLVTHCHCADCRKTHGAAFATNGSVRPEDFRLVAGEALVRAYESSPGKQRCFCARCGAKLFARFAGGEGLRIRLSSLDDDPGVRPRAHIWLCEAAPWDEVAGTLPRFERGLA